MEQKTFLIPAAVVSILACAGLVAVGLLLTKAIFFRSFNTIILINAPAVEIRMVVVTGYSSDLSQTDSSPYTTASQWMVREGFIACPRDLKFGTKVEINRKVYECQDRLARKYDNRFDIWMKSRIEALAWGKQILSVKILK